MAVSCDILVILGPTASGKSTLAMAVAEAIGAEILSVDSMQVYRGMDIGTAKPSHVEREKVWHHLIDLVEANEYFSVAKFVEAADAVIRDATARGVRLIATGGTPLYFKALFQGLFEMPSAQADIRFTLRDMGNEELHRKLTIADPVAAARIHPNDTRRLIRALEVFEMTGKTISSLQKEWSANGSRHPATWIGLNWDREILNRRVNARFKSMLEAGWLEETRALLARHGELSMTAGEATGYHELIEHIRGNISLEDAGEQIKIATRQLARRQMKWFRRFPDTTWLAGDRPLEELMQETLAIWNRQPSKEG